MFNNTTNYNIKDFKNHFDLVDFLNRNNIQSEDIVSISTTTNAICHRDNKAILIWKNYKKE